MTDSNIEAQKRTIRTLLTEKPVASTDSDLVCTTCNRTLSESENVPGLVDADTQTVFISLVKHMTQHTWDWQWISCEECGPVRESNTPMTANATATLDYLEKIDRVVLTNIRDISVGSRW
jgi:hypothetical protein